MTPEDARQAWEEAKERTSDARESLLRAKQKMREAEAHFNKCYDTERFAWLALQEAQRGGGVVLQPVSARKSNAELRAQRQRLDAEGRKEH